MGDFGQSCCGTDNQRKKTFGSATRLRRGRCRMLSPPPEKVTGIAASSPADGQAACPDARCDPMRALKARPYPDATPPVFPSVPTSLEVPGGRQQGHRKTRDTPPGRINGPHITASPSNLSTENILDSQIFFRLGTEAPHAIGFAGLGFRCPQGVSQRNGTPADAGPLCEFAPKAVSGFELLAGR
jgi:hypothetical protein